MDRSPLPRADETQTPKLEFFLLTTLCGDID
jgi:hypothetical protein